MECFSGPIGAPQSISHNVSAASTLHFKSYLRFLGSNTFLQIGSVCASKSTGSSSSIVVPAVCAVVALAVLCIVLSLYLKGSSKPKPADTLYTNPQFNRPILSNAGYITAFSHSSESMSPIYEEVPNLPELRQYETPVPVDDPYNRLARSQEDMVIYQLASPSNELPLYDRAAPFQLNDTESPPIDMGYYDVAQPEPSLAFDQSTL